MQKSKLFTVVDKAGQNKTVCWLGNDQFSEDIKTFDPDRDEDLDLVDLDSVISYYFEKDELTEDNDLIGKSWHWNEADYTVIEKIIHTHIIN
tara:strand:- start:380 stop:655 length:276 start_codon:yes stop_codon:yes gene_type:complete